MSGYDAIKILEDSIATGVTYQIIFTDFSMPQISGISTTKKIRELLQKTGQSRSEQPKIIGVTGHVHEQYRISGLKAGMDDVYSKPLYVENMKEILQKYQILAWAYAMLIKLISRHD